MGDSMAHIPLRQIDKYTWMIPKYRAEMKVPGLVFADTELLTKMKRDRTLHQCSNVACLPGIVKYSIVLPDGHEGYGFPIGGVAAFTTDGGVISPGGIGFDINCGVRLLTTPLTEKEVRPKLRELLETMFNLIPCGVGRSGRIRLSISELDRVVVEGVEWAIDRGYGFDEDKYHIEEFGRMEGADPDKVSHRAKQRGAPQLGTLGAGNHFLEVQRVDTVYDEKTAKAFGLPEQGGVCVMIHTGSRGYGHQICSDYLRVLEAASRKYGIKIYERELVCAPWGSKEAEDYFGAMCCAVNYAFVNRHMIMHWVREAFRKVFGLDMEDLKLVYDVCHNVGKIEEHVVDGKRMTLIVHRKGATRAFAAGRKELPPDYRNVGQPVLIPGSMGTASYVLVGTETAMERTFGSTAHGAGREMSRAAAIRRFWGRDVQRALESRGILIRAASWRGIAEEAPQAYKNVDKVADVSHEVGIATKVVRLTPIGVLKG